MATVYLALGLNAWWLRSTVAAVEKADKAGAAARLQLLVELATLKATLYIVFGVMVLPPVVLSAKIPAH